MADAAFSEAEAPALPVAAGLAPMLAAMRFRGDWRDYQKQVLDELEGCLANGRLHVVAPPGAGKTVLGLEIVRRLGRPALVFTPTIAIREQWLERLAAQFLNSAPRARDVSRDLAAPAQLTVASYQALDGFRRADELDRLIASLNMGGPLTLVLDEAHHLRREWGASIDRLAGELTDLRIVALTATPPYDAGAAEWTRYEGLCGPIDLEIGAPELVRNGDLCPHQDHVILSVPTQDALELLHARGRAIWTLQRELWADAELLDLLQAHPWLRRPAEHVEAILDAPEMLSAVLVFLTGAGRTAPAAALKLLGVSRRQIPKPSFFWLERFLDGVTGAHAGVFGIGADRVKALRGRLHREGLIEGGRVRLRETRAICQLMAASVAKFDSISAIACAEDAALGENLRMVVLSDHVRAGEMPVDPEAPFRPAKLGVVPIFEQLRRAGVAQGSVGVLTGSLVIVPRAALPALAELAAEHGLQPAAIEASGMPACPDHVRVEILGTDRGRLVALVTGLFTRGAVRILVGTQSLLGEGWDAPTLNSLVLASNTAAFMLSNQMRGRAIRCDPAKPEKVANIWHLATVAPPAKDPLGQVVERLEWGALWEPGAGFADTALLHRRFRAFEGIANDASVLIESGIGRLGLDPAAPVEDRNRRTFAAAADRQEIARRWSASIGAGGPRARVRETAAPNYAPRRLAWSQTLHALVWSAVSAGLYAMGDELTGVDSYETFGALMMGLAIMGGLAAAPKLARAVHLLWRNGSVEGSLEQVGIVILGSLAEAGVASEAELRNGAFDVRTSLDGRRDIVLRGVSRGVERQVMQALTEALGPVQNPRYLLVRGSRLGWRTRTDYHAVPAAVGAKKAWAERYARLWNQRVGPSRLIYTRTPEGRRILLRARARSLAAGFQRSVDRRSAWL